MALAPKYAALKLSAGSATQTVHTLELFLDYVCPYSKKMFNTVYTSVNPLIKASYQDKLAVIFRPQIQPWHPSSTLTHEAAIAVLNLSPDKFWEFSKKLFDHQIDYFDVNVVNETRNQTYKRLADLAAEAGVDSAAVYKLLEIPDKPKGDSYNVGNGVTNDLKKLVKQNRLVGIHVTPTVIFDGLVEPSIESSFSVQQWDEWLKKNIV
ncbi:hypothetical protein BT63DRAFT_420688 [Microthyrium microscopicum]|uniref:Thioredoxin-like fold domain-containing protein n=1 Tax=Microthyrium microscopicum TaxID=703497 RepID=A0A6A6UWY6_9PEZI|nr:hypothetical protein BT63DRAFT_420688 [Microthyrium microscopicum]